MRGLPGAVPIALSAGLALAAPAWADVSWRGFGVVFSTMTTQGPEQLPATILKPQGSGPFPAVVILHDCSGLGPRSSGAPRRWGDLLAAQGYVVMLPDSFAPRGFPNGVCTVPPGPQHRPVNIYQRARDAYGSLAYLRTLPYVDGRHVGVMGGSHGGSSTLAALSAPSVSSPDGGFAAAVALYPSCGTRYGGWNVARQFGGRGPVTAYYGTYAPAAPLLILIGAEDDWTPAAHCEALAQRSTAAGYPVEIHLYPGAQHSFDSTHPARYLDARTNINKPAGHGATTGGNAAAWADSIKRVEAFFAAHLETR